MREAARKELLDLPGTDPAELAGSLRDIARLNRLGPTQSLLARAAPFLARHQGPGPFRILDLGTGNADVPVAFARWARRRGRRVTVVGLDLHPGVVACARTTTRGLPEVRLVTGEARQLPIRPGSVDLAVCSLMLHHLSEAAVMEVLRLMADTARLGFLVSDLRRSRAAWLAAWLATRAISRNRVTRHDGPLSARRAYTVAELTRLSAAAGLPEVRWRSAIAFRVIGVYERGRLVR
jgi:ubiquinone/menaquinone biosynthesis C-methylase UbiE